MKSVAASSIMLFVGLAAAQDLELERPDWISPNGPAWEKCEDVCTQSVDSQIVCDRRYVEDITLEDHQECMCGTVFPETYDCLTCAVEASEELEQEEVYGSYSIMVDIYSSSMCGPSASIFFDEVIQSMDVEEESTKTGSMLTLTPIKAPIDTATTTNSAPTGTPSGDEGEDDDEEANNDEPESTGAAPAITQAPFVFAAAGMALAAAL